MILQLMGLIFISSTFHPFHLAIIIPVKGIATIQLVITEDHLKYVVPLNSDMYVLGLKRIF